MYVRLAFAVAAHLEPEILLVDEVLAVGDAEFQKKCLGKMNDVSKEGRTVLFVSHNLNAIAQLCGSAILFDGGKMVRSGDVNLVTSLYLSEGIPTAGDLDLSDRSSHSGSGEARLSQLMIMNGSHQVSTSFVVGDDIVFDISIDVRKQIGTLLMSVDIATSEGLPVYHLRDVDAGFNLENPSEKSRILVRLKNQKLYPGDYLISLWLGGTDSTRIDYVHNCARFTVRDGGSVLTRPLMHNLGMVYEVAEWTRLQ
jgi:lipopolysaccharide transport system ATP-binding protein